MGADADGRVVVTDILETSDAYRRGLRYDDEIISFGGRPISTPNGFKNVLGIFPKGWRVPLSYRRDGKRHDILVRLGRRAQRGGTAREGDAVARPAEPMPLPKPGDGPKSGAARPWKAARRIGRQPLPHPAAKPLARTATLPVPEIVKKHFEDKRGYANYYFNTLEQQRVWKAWNARDESGRRQGRLDARPARCRRAGSSASN